MIVLQFLGKLTGSVDNGRHSAGIFLYLSKAFDIVDNNIIICKLSHVLGGIKLVLRLLSSRK